MDNRIYGYARVSTTGQNEDRQLEALTKFGVPEQNIIIDKASGKDTEREGYQYLKRQILRAGDTLVIKELDRLSRNKADIKRELEEFKAIINEKLRLARRDYDAMMRQIMNQDGNDVDDTSPTYKALEEGSLTQSKEELVAMANRQQKFITGLEAALVRIKNKTYGIDRITGELIPKERLRAVPHATLSVASKQARDKK